MAEIRKGDLVEVISGSSKGIRGEIIKSMPRDKKVLVRGANVKKKHQRPIPQLREGGIIEREEPIYASKVMVVCPNCNSTTKVGYKFLEDGSKVRICKKCGEVLDKE